MYSPSSSLGWDIGARAEYWLVGPDCKSGTSHCKFNSYLAHFVTVAQLVEALGLDPRDTGSSPVGDTLRPFYFPKNNTKENNNGEFNNRSTIFGTR